MITSTARELEGKVAIVTGGARRTGSAIALRLALAGANVVVNARESLGRAREVAERIEAEGSQALPFIANVTDPVAVGNMVDATLSRFGRIDILVNNAAVRRKQSLLEISLEDWRAITSIILDGAFICAKACAPSLIESHGSIVNIGGAAAHVGSPGHAHVMAAKAGLVGLTRALAVDLGPYVVVNCLAPGNIQDPTDDLEAQIRRQGYALRPIPAGRPGTVGEIAEGVAMLCNPKCRFLTGQTIHVNGGVYFSS